MDSKGVRYHKSAEDVDEEKCDVVKPLTVGYCRFSVLERVLLAVVCVLFIIALIFIILYATALKDSSKSE